MTDPQRLAVPTNAKPYPVIFLVPGPRHAELSGRSLPINRELQAEHLLYVKQNIEAGTMIMAVPILEAAGAIAAMGVFRQGLPLDELHRLMEQDVFVSSGRFSYQVHTALLPALDPIKVVY